MKIEKQYRSFDLDTRKVDSSKRSIFLSFSSETPVERMYSGELLNEVLDHSPSSVDLGRLKTEGAILLNHDPDHMVGKVEQVEIVGRRGKARVRFGRTDLANETWSLIEDGILSGVSVGYEIHEAIREQDDTLRVTKWTPTEISMVTNAADLTVGVGRSQNTSNELIIKDSKMTIEAKEETRGKTAYDRGINEGKQEALDTEGVRVKEIQELCEGNNPDLALRAISENYSTEAVKQILREIRMAGYDNSEPSEVIRASHHGYNNRTDTINRDLDEYVRSKGQVRGLSINGGITSGELAVVPFRDSEMHSLLREASPIRGLVDVVMTDNTTQFEEVVTSGLPGSSWVSESGSRTETSNATLNMVTTYLHEIYSLQTLTQRLIDQSYYDLSTWLQQSMATSIAELESDAFVNGLGAANEPLGLVNHTLVTTNDDSRAFGDLQYTASGNASALDDADKLIELLYELKSGYRSRSTWLMNSNTARTIMQLKDGEGCFLWSHGDIASDRPATLLGRPVVILEDLPNIGANAFPVWIGDWRTAIRFLNGATSNVTPDPYTNRPNVDFYSYFYVGFMVRDTQAVKALKIEA